MKDLIKKIIKEDIGWIADQGEPFSESIRIVRQTPDLANTVKMTVEVMHGDGDSYDTTTSWFIDGEVNPRWGNYEYINGRRVFGRGHLRKAKDYVNKLGDGWCENCCDELNLSDGDCELFKELGLIKPEPYSYIDGSIEDIELVYYDENGNQYNAEFI